MTAVLWCAGSAAALQARGKIYSLIEKTRMASVIVIGEITTLQDASVLVRVQTRLKGEPPSSMTLSWDRRGTVEERPAAHTVGDQVLVFADPEDNTYRPFAGPQGTIKLPSGTSEQYANTVRQILNFESAADANARTGVLVDMLGSNRLAQSAALETVYVEYPTGRFATDPLLAPVVRIAQQDDPAVAIRAIQVLSRIAQPDQIPILIRLMGSRDGSIAETAFRAVKGLTNANLPFDPKQGPDARTAAARAWAEWWNSNKDSVVLLK